MECDPTRSSWKYNKRHWITPELNYSDLTFNAVRFASGGPVRLTQITQGTSVTTRVGKRISLVSLECHGYIVNESAADYNFCEVVIVYDRRPTGSTAGSSDVFNTSPPTGASTRQINDQNADRFEIIYRKSYTLVGAPGTASTTVSDSTIVDCSFLLDLGGRPVVYKLLGTGASSDMAEGDLLVFLNTNRAAGTNDVATLNCTIRLRFCDNS